MMGVWATDKADMVASMFRMVFAQPDAVPVTAT
jgi:hypothetical protein